MKGKKGRRKSQGMYLLSNSSLDDPYLTGRASCSKAAEGKGFWSLPDACCKWVGWQQDEIPFLTSAYQKGKPWKTARSGDSLGKYQFADGREKTDEAEFHIILPAKTLFWLASLEESYQLIYTKDKGFLGDVI